MSKIFEIKTDYFSDDGISLNLEQRTNIIYGSNGTGKTTISKCIEKDFKNKASENKASENKASENKAFENKAFVFNQEFVNKNVFYSNDGGFQDVSPENKKNRSKLLVSQRCIDIDKYIFDISKENEEVRKSNNVFSPNDIKIKFKYNDEKVTAFVNGIDDSDMGKIFDEINGHNEIVNLALKEKEKLILNAKDEVEINELYCDIVENYKNLIDTDEFIKEFDYSKNNDFIELIIRSNNWNEIVKLNNLITVATEFQENNINKIKELVSKYLKEADNNTLIKSVYLDLINILKKHVNINDDEIKELEKAAHIKEINEWITKGHGIHRNIKDFCYYCKNKITNKVSIVDEILLKANESQKTESFNALSSFFEECKKHITSNVDSLKRINQENNWDNKTTEHIMVEKALEIYDGWNQLIASVEKMTGNNNNDQIEKRIEAYKQIEIELLSENNIKIENNIQLIANNLIQGNEEFVIKSMQLNYFNDIAKHCQQRLKEMLEMENTVASQKISQRYKELTELNLSPLNDIELKLSKSGANTKGDTNYQLDIIDAKTKKAPYNTMSSGQRSMLAFLIFIIQIEEYKDQFSENDIIVIDDPVDGMDYFSYITTCIITNNLANNISKPTFLVLSHNYEFINALLMSPSFKDSQLTKLTYDKRIISITQDNLLQTDISLITSFINRFSNMVEENEKDLNTLYLVSSAILITKVVDNYLYSIIEENVGINLIPTKDMYVNIKESILNNKEKIENYNEIIDFIDIYRGIRNSNNKKDGDGFFDDKRKVEVLQVKLKELLLLFKKFKVDTKFIDVLIILCDVESSKFSDNYCNFSETEIPNDIRISFEDVQLIRAAQIMFYAKNNKGVNNESLRYLSNNLRHSPYSLSDPIITFDFSHIIKKVNKTGNEK
jgi:ABC-type molybdenum transport system ATPase subunit/photorepair protein PhrA